MAPFGGTSRMELSPENDNYDTTLSTELGRKSVCFSDFSELYYVPHLHDMSQEEFHATYMTNTDYQRIRRDNEETLEIMKNGNYPGTTEKYFRGLEPSLKRKERKQLIDQVVSTFLRGQEIFDSDWLRNYYSKLTAPAVAVASAMGAWDAEAMQAEIQAELEEQKAPRRRKQSI